MICGEERAVHIIINDSVQKFNSIMSLCAETLRALSKLSAPGSVSEWALVNDCNWGRFPAKETTVNYLPLVKYLNKSVSCCKYWTNNNISLSPSLTMNKEVSNIIFPSPFPPPPPIHRECRPWKCQLERQMDKCSDGRSKLLLGLQDFGVYRLLGEYICIGRNITNYGNCKILLYLPLKCI